MSQKEYSVEGRSFRTEADYKLALRDKAAIERLRAASAGYDVKKLEQLKEAVHSGKYKFYTLLGQDFEDELADRIKQQGKLPGKQQRKQQGKPPRRKPVEVSEAAVQEELKRREKRRRLTIVLCSVTAIACLGYFGAYSYYNYRTESDYDALSALKEKEPVFQGGEPAAPVIHYNSDEPVEIPEVLEEYKNLLNKNKRLIGWVKIDDTNIDYPVMQTVDNEYYLDHNLNQEYDKNGSIFMDKDCDVLKPSTNLILYGHHMKSGKMFGDLDQYEQESYYEEHKYINFDTIYEKGLYEVMYVFRSRVYSEAEVVFKYYQFIDALSEVEFNSYMDEMAAISLYDTGVTAEYGDRLLTLSTCDYQEKNGRFVVVARKVTAKEYENGKDS